MEKNGTGKLGLEIQRIKKPTKKRLVSKKILRAVHDLHDIWQADNADEGTEGIFFIFILCVDQRT